MWYTKYQTKPHNQNKKNQEGHIFNAYIKIAKGGGWKLNTTRNYEE